MPTDSYYDYAFRASSGDRTIPLAILTYGMQNRDEGKMLLGIYNSDNTMRNVQIRYYTTGEALQSKGYDFLENKLIVSIIQ